MRIKRVEKFRKQRKKDNRNLIIFAFLVPGASVFLGYILTSFVILPIMEK
jgi:hypothetical protein